MDHLDYIATYLDKSLAVKQKLKDSPEVLGEIAQVAQLVVDAYARGNKVLIAGNGGSAADAQHIAAEFVSRFFYDRPGLPADPLRQLKSYYQPPCCGDPFAATRDTGCGQQSVGTSPLPPLCRRRKSLSHFGTHECRSALHMSLVQPRKSIAANRPHQPRCNASASCF